MQAISEMINFFRVNHRDLKGCTVAEIELLEQHHQLKLPNVYRAFLQLVGHDARGYQVGSNYDYPWLLTSKEFANELLARNERPPLPDNTFVFWGHQGYQFCFFYTDTAEGNPLVYYYNECYEIPTYLEISRLDDALRNPGSALEGPLKGVKDNGRCC